MAEAKIAAKEPAAVEVKAGVTYYWCSCGLSEQQPFCDGSHKDSGFAPRAFTAEKDETLYFCQCKRTKRPPLCDGSHKNL